MNFLTNYFSNNKNNAIHKWLHYFDIYDLYFAKYRGKEVHILEIGVFQGGSLRMWREYFGEKAKIYAIDINPLCKQFESDSIQIFIGSQDDREFLRSVKERIPKLDIVIDDGGHEMNQQIASFEELYTHINDDGIYLCEDLHTSYWEDYGGGYKSPNSFIEYSKNFIDLIHAWHIQNNVVPVNDFTRSTYALHYYDSIIVVEKGVISKPEHKVTGEFLIPLENFPTPNRPKSEEEHLIVKNTSTIKKWIKLFAKKLGYRITKINNSEKTELKGKHSHIKRFTPVERDFLGKKIYIHDIASFQMSYEELFIQEMYKFETDCDQPFIIDCGANLGMSLIYFKQLYPNSKILAFEPDKEIFEFLKRNTLSFAFTDVELINAALWDKEELQTFWAEGGAGGRIEAINTRKESYNEVHCVRLRNYLNEKKVHFLKIDIEGAEYQVIKDCADLLINIDNIFIEYHSLVHETQKLDELLSFVKNAGFRYHIKEAFTNKTPFVNRTTNYGMDLQLNIFCYKS